MNDDFVESILLWNEKGSSNSVIQWLQEHGLSTTPMRAGLLITGRRERFETAFSVDLKNVEPPLKLPVPEELKEHVASIGIPKPRHPH